MRSAPRGARSWARTIRRWRGSRSGPCSKARPRWRSRRRRWWTNDLLPCICRGGGPLEERRRGRAGTNRPLHQLRWSPSPGKPGEERVLPMSYDSFVRDRLPPAELLPEFRFELPELHYPERFNAAAELLKEGAPEDLAVVNDHGRWTYAELDDFSGRIARFLIEEQQLIPGKRVLLRGPNGYTMFAAWLGVLK